MLPADQRLDADHAALAHVHLGLVIQHELAGRQRRGDAIDGIAVRAHLAVPLRIEDLVAVASLLLGGVHRLVGVAQQGVGIGVVERIEGDADAGGNDHRAASHGQGLRDRLQQADQRRFALLHVLGAEQQHELVAAEPGHGVAAPQALAQAVGDLDQQAIARLVTKGVVDRLEAVEIDVADRHQPGCAAGQGQRLVHAIGQQDSVGNAGQRVVMGNVLQLALLFLEVADVGEHAEGAVVSAVGIKNGGAGYLGPQLAAVLAAEAPLVMAADSQPPLRDLLAVPRDVVGIDQLFPGATQQLLLRVAQHVGHALVEEGDAQLAVDDPDALVGGLDDAAVARLALGQGPFRMQALGDVLDEAVIDEASVGQLLGYPLDIHPADAAVRRDRAHLLARPYVPRPVGPVGGNESVQVVRVDAGEGDLRVAHRLGRRHAQQGFEAVAHVHDVGTPVVLDAVAVDGDGQRVGDVLEILARGDQLGFPLTRDDHQPVEALDEAPDLVVARDRQRNQRPLATRHRVELARRGGQRRQRAAHGQAAQYRRQERNDRGNPQDHGALPPHWRERLGCGHATDDEPVRDGDAPGRRQFLHADRTRAHA